LSPRTRATFAKRQKEQARREKQHAKAQRKQERKLENQQAREIGESDYAADEIISDLGQSPVSEIIPDLGQSPVSQMDSNVPLSETQPEEKGKHS
jgi:hypothetical protein